MDPFKNDNKRILGAADEDGVLIEVLGGLEILELTREVYLLQGGIWSEATKGTNAIGTAIIEQKPVQIYAQEHLSGQSLFYLFSCSYL
ncbi:MAG: hypothetical protein ACYC0N_03330 [Carboxydocellales bacterium]